MGSALLALAQTGIALLAFAGVGSALLAFAQIGFVLLALAQVGIALLALAQVGHKSDSHYYWATFVVRSLQSRGSVEWHQRDREAQFKKECESIVVFAGFKRSVVKRVIDQYVF